MLQRSSGRGWLISMLLVALLTACAGPGQAPLPTPSAELAGTPIGAARRPTATAADRVTPGAASPTETELPGISPSALPSVTASASSASPMLTGGKGADADGEDGEAVRPTVPPLERTLQVQDPPMAGADVDALIERLVELEYASAERVTGVYDGYILGVVRAFQEGHGLEVDGVVGPQTWTRLFSRLIDPNERVYPIIKVTGERVELIGGAHKGRWIDGVLAASVLGEKMAYTVYGMDRQLGEAIGLSPVRGSGPHCWRLRPLELQVPAPEGTVIGIGGGLSPFPRVPEQLSPKEVYREAVARHLQEQGIEQPEVRITRVLRVDLEGDGTNEVLINASRLSYEDIPVSVAAGDYSVVLLRRVVNGDVETIPLMGEYYLRAEAPTTVVQYVLDGAFDLNGDGQMEIVVSWSYHEGDGIQVYQFKDGKAQLIPALSLGCGL